MVEAFDAARTSDLWRVVLLILVFIATGAIFDYVIFELLYRLAERAGWRFTAQALKVIKDRVFVVIAVLGVLFSIAFASNIPDFVRRWLLEILQYVLVLGVAFVVVRILTGWIELYFSQRETASVSILQNIVRVFSAIVILTALFQVAGFEIAPLLTVIAGSSVGLAFALQDPLKNIFSGIQIVASNKIRPGDYVRLASGQEGYVTDIRWSDTYIRELANNLIVVPNSQMTSAIIVNYDQPEPELSVLFNVGVSYDSDLKHVEEVTIAVANEVMHDVTGGVRSFETFIRYNTFDAYSINFTTILRGQTFVDQYLIKHEFVKRLHERYQQEGIVIPYPIRTLHTPHEHPLAVFNASQRDGSATPQPDSA